MEGFDLNSNGTGMTNADPYILSNSDHPRMSLTATKFNGMNFLGWSRTVKMALRAKQKLCFIDGSLPKPLITSPDYQKWVRCDYMVTCWLLNSLEAELSDAFLYAQSGAELWKEISERYGHVTGPQVYPIQKDLNEISQGSLSVAAYFTKLKKCWDELNTLDGDLSCTCGQLNQCSCGLFAKMAVIENRNRLMQFLLKLRSDFDTARSQILAIDPLPNVNKAYYLIQQIEAQQNITRTNFEHTAFMAHVPGQRYQTVGRRKFNKGKSEEKKYCRHCHSEWHVYEQCFERIGCPDWYKGRKGRKPGRAAAHVRSTSGEIDDPLGMEVNTDDKIDHKKIDSCLMNAMCQEVVRMLRNSRSGMNAEAADFSHAGPYN